MITSYYFKTFSAKVKQKRGNVYTNENILFLKRFSAKMKKKGTFGRVKITSVFDPWQVL